MARLTKQKIGKLLCSHNVGNFSALRTSIVQNNEDIKMKKNIDSSYICTDVESVSEPLAETRQLQSDSNPLANGKLSVSSKDVAEANTSVSEPLAETRQLQSDSNPLANGKLSVSSKDVAEANTSVSEPLAETRQLQSDSNPLANGKLSVSSKDVAEANTSVSEPLAETRQLQSDSNPLANGKLSVSSKDVAEANTSVSEPLAETRQLQSDSNPLANGKLSVSSKDVAEANTSVSEPLAETRQLQSDSNPLANGKLSVSSKDVAEANTSVSEPLAETRQLQSDSNPLANGKLSVSSKDVAGTNTSVSEPLNELEWASILTGKEFDLTMYLVTLCQKSCSLKTPPVFTKDLVAFLSVSPNHLRNIISRLNWKKILKVLLNKSSKHALRVFQFEKHIFSLLVDRREKEQKEKNNDINQVIHYPMDNALPEEYKNLDWISLEKIGFNESHLIQIYRDHKRNPEHALSCDIIQDSINAFAFDLKYNAVEKNFRNAPIVVLLSLLKKGIPYSSKTPEKFITPKEEAMRDYIETKHKQLRLKEELEKKLMDIACKEWEEQLTQDEFLEFYPDLTKTESFPPGKLKDTYLKVEAIKNAKAHFFANIWPAKKLEALSNEKQPV